MQTFRGYQRADGSVGIRNLIMIIAADECAEGIARAISEKTPGSVVVTNYNTCMYGGNEEMIGTMINAATNPNIAGALVINMGCGSIAPDLVAGPIRATGRPVETLTCIKESGTVSTIREGLKRIAAIVDHANATEMVDAPISKLFVGIKCGGSDTSSGIASNPSVGLAADKLIDMGASAVAGELLELLGCEHILKERAVTPEVFEKIEQLISDEEKRWHVEGTQVETMSVGNSIGGLTTIEEKSLGALAKTGSKPIQDILRINAKKLEKPEVPGMYLSETTMLCGGSAMHFAALGCQVILWTTGGAGFNNPIVPVIRVSGNSQLINEDIDIDATGIMRGEDSLENVSEEILKTLAGVINGEKTAIEDFGYAYCSLIQKDQRVERLLSIPAE
ncbi:protein containing D-galactarate dehydratase/Altronate hydrolase, C-terminal domain [Pseudovibrio sp. FO-BEG1]|uniref:Altronate dehydratase large subunit n=1 Tax=Pseudovibrio denitrificans TaxID=258256 RepID=A0A1I7CMY9_9HYPH|nr:MULTISPECIES: UxaA family hydrolase [Pseudovibrio]AEV35647.1 protein containing D-galactarate dehydratase/Altronate hydrolase, C-terminal domain [Pseudovibrio sp. FO-BEG1]SFU00826.1 altronate dehydratase large subunit [Pseudovibrio denitrificans]